MGVVSTTRIAISVTPIALQKVERLSHGFGDLVVPAASYAVRSRKEE
jgi:hypothetical protein